MTAIFGAAIAISIAIASTSFGQYAGIAKHRRHEANIPAQLLRFGASDFDLLTHQQRERLTASHASKVIVHWPNGRRTRGLEQHVHDVETMFAYAPDARIRAHPVKFGSDEWTCVISELEGTFTNAWRTPEGKEIQPTGRHFRITICTVRHWNRKGLTDEEYLFWDNHRLLQQLGLAR